MAEYTETEKTYIQGVISDLVREMREAVGMSRKEFAEAVGSSRKYIEHLENGVSSTNLLTLYVYANRCGYGPLTISLI